MRKLGTEKTHVKITRRDQIHSITYPGPGSWSSQAAMKTSARPSSLLLPPVMSSIATFDDPTPFSLVLVLIACGLTSAYAHQVVKRADVDGNEILSEPGYYMEEYWGDDLDDDHRYPCDGLLSLGIPSTSALLKNHPASTLRAGFESRLPLPPQHL
ncbi:unnamed protein product [Cyclocybe aegerita]|uniref:Uncharacterized protein n=1 Tax=Cyclocybe aegerita TaxID=1973307 RepID=A0A8S0VUC5_CYCAE|nr:unnamed protein product [Cyclocybe aegerita]